MLSISYVSSFNPHSDSTNLCQNVLVNVDTPQLNKPIMTCLVVHSSKLRAYLAIILHQKFTYVTSMYDNSTTVDNNSLIKLDWPKQVKLKAVEW